MHRLSLLLSLLVLSAGMTACSSTPSPEDAQAEGLNVSSFEFEPQRYPAIHEAAVEVLRDYGFRVSRNDYRFGRVSSYPKESPTLAEFWIEDASTTSQGLSDTLNAHQRTARIRVEGFDITQPVELATGEEAPAPTYTLSVEVLVQRLQNPDRYLTSSATGRAVANYTETPTKLRSRGINGSYAQTLTRDPQLETRLLEAIVKRALAQ